jgi:D-inositol-3-phosphate glycosyltransferase
MLGIDEDVVLLTFVGRVQPHKGPDVLIRAAAELLREQPWLRATLRVAIVGGASGSAKEPQRLAELADWLGVAANVLFIPPVGRDLLPQWYRASDVVCVPSHSESFGLVAVEAQACGTPVVAAAVGGLRTAVADGFSGLLVEGHLPREWAVVLGRLINEPRRRQALSEGALVQAQRFGWENTAERTLEVYRRARRGGLESIALA